MVKIKSPRAPARTSFVSNYCHLCPTIAVSAAWSGQKCPRFPEEVQLLAVRQQRPGFVFKTNADDSDFLHGNLGETQTQKYCLINWKWTVCCVGHHEVMTTTKEKESSTSKTNGPDQKELVSSEDLSSHYRHVQQSCMAHQSHHHQSNLRPPNVWKFQWNEQFFFIFKQWFLTLTLSSKVRISEAVLANPKFF